MNEKENEFLTKYNLPIQILERKHDGLSAVKLTEEPYEGIIFSYGKVGFDVNEEDSTLKINFDYEVHDMNNKVITDPKPFEEYIGKILEELIHLGIRDNSVTYTGGVDENTTTDSSESNSQ